MSTWDIVADEQTIQTTIRALENNGIRAVVVNSGKEAKGKALEYMPEGSEIMTMTSVTLDTIGLSEEINKVDGKYAPVRAKLSTMDRKTQHQEMNQLGSAPLYAIGSVHAVTENGHVIIASATGSQLPAYAYGASHIIWVVGAQKIVKNIDDGMKRIYEYTLPLESERAKKAYGVSGSAVNKILIINKEVQQERITLIFVREKLGF